MSRRRRNHYNNKKKRGLKKIGTWLLAILAVVLACACVIGIFGGDTFSIGRDRNPDNLIPIGKDSGYILSQDTNRGVEINVKDDGTIKLSGKASSDHSVTVSKVTLEPGTYTISGLDSEVNVFWLSVIYGSGDVAISGAESDTFTIAEKQTVTITLNWVKDHNFNVFTGNTVRPVLVEGKEPGEFYS